MPPMLSQVRDRAQKLARVSGTWMAVKSQLRKEFPDAPEAMIQTAMYGLHLGERKMVRSNIKKMIRNEILNHKFSQLLKTEKWDTDAKIKKLDKYGKEQQPLSALRSQAAALRKKETRTPAETKKLRQLNFAIRARTGWGKATEGVKLSKSSLRRYIREEVMKLNAKKMIKEALTKKDFVAMANYIKRAPEQHREELIKFAVEISKADNPRFSEGRFRAYIGESKRPKVLREAKSYKVGVKTAGDSDWVFNAMRFPSEAAARKYANNLAWRWTAVKAWKVFPSDDSPTEPDVKTESKRIRTLREDSGYKVYIKTSTDPDWVEIIDRFSNKEAAEKYIKDLASRWRAIRTWKIEPYTE
jgi:hypothetical protein